MVIEHTVIGVVHISRDRVLNSDAAGVHKADTGHTLLQRTAHDLLDLLAGHTAHGSTLRCEVLRIDIDTASVHIAEAHDNSVAGDLLFVYLKACHSGLGPQVQLNEGARIKKKLHTLAGGELSPGVLFFNCLASSTLQKLFPARSELCQPLSHVH